MKEAEWLAATDVDLAHVIRETGAFSIPRRARLWVCAYCRWLFMNDFPPPARLALEAAEQYADGRIDHEMLRNARSKARACARRILNAVPPPGPQQRKEGQAATYAALAAETNIRKQATVLAAKQSGAADTCGSSLDDTMRLLRDIVYNPFRRCPNISLRRLPPLVTSIARVAYEERLLPSGHLDPTHLAVLSDALEEAEFSNSEILNHLRSPGPHVRGCWALDFIRGQAIGDAEELVVPST